MYGTLWFLDCLVPRLVPMLLVPYGVVQPYLLALTRDRFLSKKRDVRHELKSSQLRVAGPKLAVGVMCGHVTVDLRQFHCKFWRVGASTTHR